VGAVVDKCCSGPVLACVLVDTHSIWSCKVVVVLARLSSLRATYPHTRISTLISVILWVMDDGA
jgi:hypothetical protein